MTMTRKDQTERRRKIAEFCASGKTVPEAMGMFGVSAGTVVLSCRAYGARWRREDRKVVLGPTVNSLEVIAALQAGENQSDVARRFGLTRQRIGQIRTLAIKAGMQMPSAKEKP